MIRVRERYRVTFDSAMDNCFHVHKSNGKTLQSQEASRSLYYFDTKTRDEEDIMIINAVDTNKSKLSALDLTQAKRARALQKRIGRPTAHDYIHYISMNMIPNCPVTIYYIINVKLI